MPVIDIHAENKNSKTGKDSKSGRSASDDNFMGLTQSLYFCLNAQVILTNNVWTNSDLTNGSKGIIRDIIFRMEARQHEMPMAIIVEVENYSGPQFFEEASKKNWIPINPICPYCNYTNSTRKQFPLKLAYAITIHKSQGETLELGVIELGKSEKGPWAFVCGIK
jgi:ATP-dependent exoDNAse (exonuclease V) alpha subunit